MDRKAVFETLKIDEGVEYKIYADHLGYHTFGVGHLITEEDPEWGMSFDTPVSEDRVWEAFDKDLDTAISECKILFDEFDSFDEEAQQVIVNMMFNMGRPRLSGFKKFCAAAKEGDWKTAAVEGRDSKWYRQVTNRAERLMSRLEEI